MSHDPGLANRRNFSTNAFLRRAITGAFAYVLVAAPGPTAHAGDWRIVPRLSINETFSDNVQLDSVDEQDDFVTMTTPGISVRGDGKRIQMNLDYNLQDVRYANSSNLANTFHQLQSGVSMELFRNVFFVDVDAAMYQALVENTGTISNRNFRNNNNNNNRTDVTTWGVRPRFSHHFGSWADFNASTGFSDTIGDARGGGRSSGSGNGQNLSTTLTSGRRFTRTNWSISHNRTLFNNDSGARSNSRNRWRAQGGLRLNRYFRFNTSVGFENNKSSGGRGDGSGVTWSVGGTFSPSSRSSLTGSYGDRAFGSTKNFSFRHRHRRINITGSYSEDLSTSNDQLRNQQLIPLEDAFGNPVFDPFQPGDVDLPFENLTLTDDLFVNRNFRATVGYERKRDTFSASVFYSEREGDSNSDGESAVGTTLRWTHAFSRRMSGGVSGSYRSGSGQSLREAGGAPRVGSGANTTVDVISVSPYVSYSIGPHTNGRLNYSYTESDSDTPTARYVENSFSASLSFAF